MNIHDAITEHAEQCEKKLPKIYVSWIWVAGILVSFVGAGYFLSDKISTVERKVDKIEVMKDQVSYIADWVDSQKRKPVK
jgi:hypothetical protein